MFEMESNNRPMKLIASLAWLLLLLGACQNTNLSTGTTSPETDSPRYGIAIHGGAGTLLKEHMSDSLEQVYKTVLNQALEAGYQILDSGGSSLDAIAASIRILEDSPLFNAGKGAVFTYEGTNQLDASVMDGATLNAGAVAGVSQIKNPIDLALQVMQHSPHVLLAGEGAEQFAKEQGIEWVDPSYFYTEDRYKNLLQAKKQSEEKWGTVGAVALDKDGNLAAGTSTGGMTNKRWNRIGDSPIIGAGTYANNATCAVSSTGWGEYFIRGVVAYDISAMMEYKGISLEEAAEEVIMKKLPKLGGDGGVIAMDRHGNIVTVFNTPGMYRAAKSNTTDTLIEIFNQK